jgi:GntR family transcriptional regulator, transcriptional repressor for pyruvate dehydrogenase complex
MLVVRDRAGARVVLPRAEVDMAGTTLTEQGIRKIRGLIEEGELRPGSRLPPEGDLATLIGTSRNTAREAVSALANARVLDVRRGDGTYVTSLSPRLLLEGFGLAIDLLQEDRILEILEVRRVLEPVATGLAAQRVSDEMLTRLRNCLDRMRECAHDSDDLVSHDAEFHALVAEAAGNQTLASMLDGLSRRTIRARAWRGAVQAGSAEMTIEQHTAILTALEGRDQALAEATALIHVATSQEWFAQMSASRTTDETTTTDGTPTTEREHVS